MNCKSHRFDNAHNQLHLLWFTATWSHNVWDAIHTFGIIKQLKLYCYFLHSFSYWWWLQWWWWCWWWWYCLLFVKTENNALIRFDIVTHALCVYRNEISKLKLSSTAVNSDEKVRYKCDCNKCVRKVTHLFLCTWYKEMI